MLFIFEPAVQLMNRLRFAYRFVLIGAAGGVLIAGLLWQFLGSVGSGGASPSATTVTRAV